MSRDDTMDHGAFADSVGRVVRTSSGREYIPALRPDGAMVVLDETMDAGRRRARVLDCVEQWATPKPGKEEGEIAPKLLEAANAFRRDYYDARKVPRYACVLEERVDKSHTANIPISDKVVKAGKRVHHAMMSMPLAIWNPMVAIVAEQEAIIAYASRTGRDRQVVKGIVIAGLECLAKAYRL